MYLFDTFFFARNYIASVVLLVFVVCGAGAFTYEVVNQSNISPSILESKADGSDQIGGRRSTQDENVTCQSDSQNFNRLCHNEPEFKFDCVFWNCSICFWGNESCLNWDIGIRTDCPHAVCIRVPKPSPPPSSNKNKILIPIISILVAIALGLLLYVLKLHREMRAYRHWREERQRLITEAPEHYQNARRNLEQFNRTIHDLAAAANIPVPPPDTFEAQPSELEQEADRSYSVSAPSNIPIPPPLPPAPCAQSPPLEGQSTNPRLVLIRGREQLRRGRETLTVNLQEVNSRMRHQFQSLRETIGRQPRPRFLRLQPE